MRSLFRKPNTLYTMKKPTVITAVQLMKVKNYSKEKILKKMSQDIDIQNLRTTEKS